MHGYQYSVEMAPSWSVRVYDWTGLQRTAEVDEKEDRKDRLIFLFISSTHIPFLKKKMCTERKEGAEQMSGFTACCKSSRTAGHCFAPCMVIETFSMSSVFITFFLAPPSTHLCSDSQLTLCFYRLVDEQSCVSFLKNTRSALGGTQRT